MPFTKENRMSTLLIISILIVICIGVTGITSIANHNTSNSTPIITSIIGFVGIAVNQLLGMLRHEMGRREQMKVAREIKSEVQSAAVHAEVAKTTAEETKQTLDQDLKDIKDKVNGNLETAVKLALEAERSQVLDKIALPKNKQELDSLVAEIVEKACKKVKEQESK